jgi:hypothetical protein
MISKKDAAARFNKAYDARSTAYKKSVESGARAAMAKKK